PFLQPCWDGSPLQGRTILLHMEQGLGDMIQFLRFAPLIKEQSGTVIVECPRNLVPLFRSCAGIDRLVAEGEPLPPFDVQAPLLTLPSLLKTTLQSVPARIPYLAADPNRVENWRHKLEPIRAFKIGIAWQGNTHFQWDRHRSFHLRHFASLAEIDGVCLVS